MKEITVKMDATSISQLKEWEEKILELQKEVDTLKKADVSLPTPPENEEEFAKYQWGLNFNTVRGYLTNIHTNLSLLRDNQEIKDNYYLDKALFYVERAKSGLNELQK
ncbi:hypothetical protein IC619_011725 [Hazenella sp. IB182353]|uniref:hypothetical protein n=1 Tax=Polycladospora coralii TaxID=2771432 RepID=UPI00174637F7|nr:hypothetical protein [Polycladospora coralii]MBS7531165.1 hypothetical protein [Polycladospora coralii]